MKLLPHLNHASEHCQGLFKELCKRMLTVRTFLRNLNIKMDRRKHCCYRDDEMNSLGNRQSQNQNTKSQKRYYENEEMIIICNIEMYFGKEMG